MGGLSGIIQQLDQQKRCSVDWIITTSLKNLL